MTILDIKNNQGKIISNSDTLSIIRENFSIANPAYRKNIPFVSSRLYAITPSGKFDTGLTGEIAKFLEDNHISYEISQELRQNYFCGFSDCNIKNLNIDYRNYQESSIISALNQGRGIVVIPTAGGKTLICAGLIESLKAQLKEENALVLVTVPTIQLVEQTAEDFLSYGLKNVTKWSGNNKPDPSANIIVASTPILLSDKTDLSILDNVKIFLMDECHTLRKGNQINKIFKLIKTPYKFGFTGTMPSSKIDQWNIISKIGPITFEQKTLTLKNQEYISDFKIIILKLKHKIKPKLTDYSNPTANYETELDFLINNNYRNEIIAKLVTKLKNNSLIMVDRINHGEILENILKNICKNERPIYFIRGSTEMEDRETIRSLMGERKDVIVVAISKIFSTGINIPNLHNIIFASAGKAKIKIMQSIGRALRLHPTKTMANIFDVADDTKYAKLHLAERIELYKNENYEYKEKEL